MKKALKALVLGAMLAAAHGASATPSTTFWTPATTYVQPYLIPHVTYDTYVAEKGLLQNTYGLTIGFLPFEKLQGEVGFDVFYPSLPVGLTGQKTYSADNFQLNGKLVLPEGAFGSWAPGVSFGIANAGFKKDYSNFDLLHATVAKTFPMIGNVGVGGYYGAGSKFLWTNSDGKTERSGLMLTWTSPDIVINKPGLNKIIFLADYASGKNWFGAVGGGIGLYFTPAIDILTGPVYFTDYALYKSGFGTNFMWTVQLDVDIDFQTPKKQ